MKILSLDFGASFVDAVLFDPQTQKLLLKKSTPRSQYSPQFLKSLPPADKIVTTGGKPKPNLPHLNEFDSLGQGGLFLTSLKSAVVVSCGTGTAVVFAQKNKPAVHLGGTGIGGGTLQGLGRLILKTDSVPQVLALAKSGDRTQVDLTVGDILGTGIGLLPQEATAANFAKLNSTKKADLAQALVNMISETIGLITCLSGQSTGQKDLVFVGRVATDPLIQTYLKSVCRLFKLQPHFHQDAAYATALGAALLSPALKI